MANFAILTAQLNLNIQDFAKNMRKASSMANQFSANLQGKINDGMVEPVKKSKFEFKDVARIVQGIIISKVFYSGLNAIRRATDAVWEFSKELEYAQMVYSSLFGDSKLATEFINVLMDFAAVTPFSFKQSEQAAKRLLAYGIEYQNIMYVMEGVLAAATVQGNEAIVEPISRAIGQIYTKGRLMNEEMRQLAEAGIPVYEILQEKLGLTAEELRNLGRTAVPANEAINALIDGINERFGATLKQANSTTIGILSNIKDNATMLIAGIFEPLAQHMKDGLADLGEFIGELRNIFELKGLGGVFERIIPPELQASIKALIVQLKMLWDILKINLGSVLSTFKYLLLGILQVFNAIGPAVMIVVGTFSALMKVITTNATLMKTLTTLILAGALAWVVYRMQALAAVVTTAVIKGITKAVAGLITAFNFLVAHPIWAFLALGVGIFVALTGASEKFRSSINNMYKSLFNMGGVDTSKLLMPESKERASDLNKFNKALSGTSKGMDDLADSTGSAAKAAKSLLGFDEVFSLKSPDEGNAAPDLSGMLEDLSGMLEDFPVPDVPDVPVPDVSEIATNFVDNLIEALGGKEALLGAAIGGLLGAALGGLIGGPLGALIGGLLGALAGYFWDDVAKALGLTDVGKIAIPIASVLGAAIGWLVGGPLGAVIGAGIGALVGWIIDALARGFTEGDWTKIGTPIGIGIGAAIGFVAGGPLGAVIGAAIGGLVGWVVDQITTGFTTGNWNAMGISLAVGTLIGGAIGFAVGGPAGALIGASIGALVGWVIGKIAENWSAITDWFAGIGPWFETLGQSIGELFVGMGEGIGTFFNNLGTWFETGWNTISTWFSNLISNVGIWFTSIFESVGTFFTNIWNTVVTIVTSIWSSVSEWFGKIWEVVSEKVTAMWNTVSEWFQKIWDTVVEKLTGVWNSVSEWFTKMWTTIKEKLNNIHTIVAEIYQKVWDTIKEKITGAYNSVRDTFTNIYTTTKTKISDMYNSVKTGIGNIYSVFTGWISDMWKNVFNKFFGWIDDGIKKLRDFFGLESKAKSTDTSRYTAPTVPPVNLRHATGGVFNREHIAHFAEGNKTEAIIPLENDTAMRPFVDAVADGLYATLAPMMSNISGNNNQPTQILYVGNLIADDAGLRELNKRMKVINLQETARRG